MLVSAPCRNHRMPRHDWTLEELIVAFNLYGKISFGQIHIGNSLSGSIAVMTSANREIGVPGLWWAHR
jgi:hypothetical protein